MEGRFRPALRRDLIDLHGGGRAIHRTCGEDKPHYLCNLARQVGVDALESAVPVDETLDDVRQPGVPRCPIETDADAVEERRAKSTSEAPPWPDTYFIATEVDVTFGVDFFAVPAVLEAQQERLRAMPGDRDLAGAQPELLQDGVFNVSCGGAWRNTHGPGDQRVPLPVLQLVVDLEGGGDVERVVARPQGRVANPCSRHLEAGRWWAQLRSTWLASRRGSSL
uniref:Uncharacterized protein n=1 Tax=Setaria viridis TaxID=4556 RepID=A0A4V6DBS4_SETVI|nr:hypothetical protein SEVIR_2G351000v2 [Setaria viridis]